MNKTEKYLPFLIALLLPLLTVVIYSVDISNEENESLLIRYLGGSITLLVIWYFNQWLIYDSYLTKGGINKEVAIVIGNIIIINIIVSVNLFVLPIGFSYSVPMWLFVLRLIMMGIIFNVIIRIIKAQKERSNLKVQNLSLQAENLKFQIETMKQQINPHFLFNSLNTLLDLIEEDKESAIRYVRNFSGLFRIVLQSSRYDFIAVEDELSFLEDYWNLLKVRFNGAINLKVEISEDKKQYQVPPLSLQLLIENAVKHNEATKKMPLYIEIMEEEDNLIVRNKINPIKYPAVSEKVGLKNLQSRYTLLFRPISYWVEDNHFIVRIPLKSM